MSRYKDSGSVVGANTGTAFEWPGGKTALVTQLSAGTGIVKLQYQAPTNASWVDCSAGRTASGFEYLDLPEGNYRVNVAAATTGRITLHSVPR